MFLGRCRAGRTRLPILAVVLVISAVSTSIFVQQMVNQPHVSARFKEFEKYPQNPLLVPNYNGKGVLHPDVKYFPAGKDGYRYWMVYTPYPPESEENPSIVRSNDGVTWTADGIQNPVISKGHKGDWDERNTADPDMVYVAEYDKWFMVWEGRDTEFDSKIAFGYSSDGKRWTEYNGISVNKNMNPVILSGTDDDCRIWERETGLQGQSLSVLYQPSLIYKNGTFYLYYVVGNNNQGKIGLAIFGWDNTEKNILNFTRRSAEPIVDLPPEDYFQSGLGHIDVYYDNETYYMYALRSTRSDPEKYELVLLSSVDGAIWTYHGKVLGTGDQDSWDGHSIYRTSPVTDGTGNVILFVGKVKLYYSAYDEQIYRIGIATSAPAQ